MQILIKGGRVIDPKNNIDAIQDIRIKDGKIIKINDSEQEFESIENLIILDAGGKLVTPGLIDMHVHFREPGFEYKETIASGCKAAAHGGFTAVCTMPNTSPVNDNPQTTGFILQKALEADLVRVYPVGAISKGLKGESLSEYKELKDAGIIALSDDGRPVVSSLLMRRALEYAKTFDLLIISHCEDLELAANGVMNEGALATRLGLAGIPNAAESIIIMRDIALCELTMAPLHIAHVSTVESVIAIRNAKKRGIPVTAETAPHYFTLTQDALKTYNTNAKMSPPLRTAKDREAVREGLADGTLDVIATDHAPHSIIEKEVEFDLAANGIVGLETSIPLGLELVRKKIIPITGLIKKMCVNPARILGLDCGIKQGNQADITIIDPDLEYTFLPENLVSLSKNTPFEGRQLKGKAVCTLVNGKIIFNEL